MPKGMIIRNELEKLLERRTQKKRLPGNQDSADFE